MLSYNAFYFGKCDLGGVYDKCILDPKIKEMFEFEFDTINGFVNYAESSRETKHHEAAFDAYMTGYCFPIIIKYKE